jgi:hypothetical protein
MAKRFARDPSTFEAIAVGFGACIASDRITVDGCPVGYMYRETPDNSTDSGWRFFAGDESQEYADNADNFMLYNINTIANYNRSIVPFLESDYGTAWGRDEQGNFVQEALPDDPDA